MTKKQRLFNHYAKLHNQLAELLGSEITYTEEYLNRYCKKINYTIAELEDMINSVATSLHIAEENKKTEEYYSTKEGQLLKTELEKQLQSVINKTIKLRETTRKNVSKMIQELLGENWDICITGNHSQIGLVSQYDDDYPQFYIGHSFTIGYDKNFNLNYGTTGDFNPFTDLTKVEYIKGLATFVSGGEKTKEIYDRLNEYCKEEWALFSEKTRLRDRLKHPTRP
jgi:hypothetical protein